MANLWIYEQKFNELNDGPLPGQDSWTGDNTFVVSTDADARYEGAKGLEYSEASGSGNVYREITPIDSGTMYISMKATNTSENYPLFYLRNDNNTESEMDFVFSDDDAKLKVYDKDETVWVQVGSETYAVDTWYRIGFQFRCLGADPYEGLAERTFKVSVNDSEWYGPYPFERLDGTDIGEIRIKTGTLVAAPSYFDFISPDYAPIVPSESPSVSPSVSPSISPSVSPSVSPSISPSVSPSESPSTSISPSVSPSVSLSVSPSVSPSESPSVSPSVSPSASISPSVSPSVSPSESPSVSPSVSPSASISPSVSPSVSPSLSPSASPSESPSTSISPSVSPSLSPSVSPSLSPSESPSVSPSVSPSASPSISPPPTSNLQTNYFNMEFIGPSFSPSISPSVSPSISPSVSPSLSPSASPSISPSVSPSASPSISPSISPSPSPGFKDYTMGEYASLPVNDNDLTTGYSVQDYDYVAFVDSDRVTQTATGNYAIHQYKTYATDNDCFIKWTGQSTSSNAVVLQIYNQNTTTWETIDEVPAAYGSVLYDYGGRRVFYGDAPVNIDFVLAAGIVDLTDYKNISGVVSHRIYQLE